MDLTLAFSPCPNDTFMFDALVNGKIDTRGLRFSYAFHDIESLNQNAAEERYDVSKLSFFAYGFLREHYSMLRSGAAIGKGCGPLLIAKEALSRDELKQSRIAIPGKRTTANFLLNVLVPEARNQQEIVFSDIEGAILKGDVDAGVIIHENRFTYEAKGLKKVIDLGEAWEAKTKGHIPLGCIVVRKSLPEEVKKLVEELVRESVNYAYSHPGTGKDFIKAHAQEMDENVMQKHIDLYVNDLSVKLGETGEHSVNEFYRLGIESGLIPASKSPLFV